MPPAWCAAWCQNRSGMKDVQFSHVPHGLVYTIIQYSIYRYSSERYFIEQIFYIQVFQRKLFWRTGTWPNGYMSERVHDHTLQNLRVHGRTGTRTNRYSIIQYSIYRYTIYRYIIILFYIKLWHGRRVILSNWYIIYWYFDEQNTIKRVHDRTGTWSYATPSTGTRANRYTGEQVFQRKLY